MARKVIQVVGALSLGAMSLPALACDLPKLPVIPATVGDQAPVVSEATSVYFEGMRAYAACLETALEAAGGDAAPASIKSVLLARSNAAVEEATAIQNLFQERVAAGQSATPGSEAALRSAIEGIAGGSPDYDAMTPEMARLARQQLGFVRPGLAAAGAISDVVFGGIGPDGHDIYEVHHENGSTTNARIGLDDAGKIEFLTVRPTPPPGTRPPTRRRSPKSY